ncbi:MAG: BC1881 family protein [Dehalobacter sp.]|nr:BC1881 family protein [Dehalobacter sp.]
MKNISTLDLTNELMGRNGVESISVEVYEEVRIISNKTEKIVQGPAIILINQD